MSDHQEDSSFRHAARPLDIRRYPAPFYFPAGLQKGDEFANYLKNITGRSSVFYEEIKNPLTDMTLFVGSPLLVLPTSVPISKEMIALSVGRIGSLASVSTGMDHVDQDALDDYSFPYFHAPGVNRWSVAEYVIGSLTNFYSPEHLSSQNFSLTLGIVGLGRIGRVLATYANALSFKICYYDPYVSERNIYRCNTLEELLLCSDMVTFHTPLTDGEFATRFMMNEQTIRYIKKNALVINTARGKIFTPDAFREVTKTHPTLMDVYPDEPPHTWMIEAPAIATPHIAGYNYTARSGGVQYMLSQFLRSASIAFEKEKMPELTPDQWELDVASFYKEESNLFKSDPLSFKKRRAYYPARSDLRRCRNRNSLLKGEFASFYENIFKVADSISLP